MGNNVKSRLHIRKSGNDRPPRKEDSSNNKPDPSPVSNDHHQPPRVRNPTGASPNPATSLPSTRGIDPQETSSTGQPTLTRGIDAPQVTLTRGN